MPRSSLAALLAVVALLVVVPAASASITLTSSGTTIGITGTGDNATFLAFDESDATVTVRNSSGVVNASSCVAEVTPTLGTYFHCPGATTAVVARYGPGSDALTLEDVCVPTVTATLGDGANAFGEPDGCPTTQRTTVTGGSGPDELIGGGALDRFDGAGGPDRLRGGAGPDVLRGGPGDDPELFGGEGDDELSGDDGADRLRGGAGDDRQDGGAGDDLLGADDADAGADDLHGGPGTDALDLDAHALGVAVSLDDVADDGSPGEGDDVHSDIEDVTATRGADTLVAGAGAVTFDGNFGPDVLRGGPGADDFDGGSDDDQLSGEGGNDTLRGGEGDDRVDGGAGLDSIFGDYSSCSAFGCSDGNDTLTARDGEADALNCGAGADSAVVDTLDVIARDGFQDCESVDRSAAPGPGPTPGPAPEPTPTTPAPTTPMPVPGPVPTSPAPAPTTPAPAPATSVLRSARATGGARRFTLVLSLRSAAAVRVTITRRGARKALGRLTIRAKAGRTTKVVRRVGGSALRAGRYRVAVRVGTTTRTLAVRVR